MPDTHAQCSERDEICLVKTVSSMCNKYCITVNELYSPLERFIIEKMLLKNGRGILIHVWGIALE